VPSALVVLDRLPLSSNGKVDRKALPAPQEQAGPRLAAEPTSELQARILAIWTEVLGLEGLGIHDHFFESGGDSVMLIRTRMRLVQALDRPVDIVDLFKYPTVASLAAFLGAGEQGADARREQTRRQAERQVDAARRARAARERSDAR